MTEYEIRPARVEDMPQLREIETLCFPDPWSRDSLASSLASPLYYTRVALVRGQVAAYLIAQLVSGEGELLRIAVRPGAQAGGIGRALAETMLKDNPGISPWRLDVRESNYGARRLYETIGFKPVIRRRSAYEKPVEDGIMMILEK